jgi:putative nucleotidyltransferase with HDIG domain
MSKLTLEQLVQYVQEIPALPDVAIKMMKMTDDPSVSARALGELISTDIALTTRVLKIANSAYYGLSRGVSTVNEAVLVLGMKALRSLALAAAAYDTLKKEIRGYSLPAGELWRHSLSCAMAAQVIAKRTRAVRSEEAFVAGLLHDVGKVILHSYVEPQFQAIWAIVELDQIPFHAAEKQVLGFDHAEVGAKIGEKWNLPVALCTAIAGHHLLERGEEAPDLTAVVHVANIVSLSEGIGFSGDSQETPLDTTAMQRLGLEESDLEEIINEMVEQIERSRSAFEMTAAA